MSSSHQEMANEGRLEQLTRSYAIGVDGETRKRLHSSDADLGSGRDVEGSEERGNKRRRTAFTNRQLVELEKTFQITNVPDLKVREILSARLGLSEKNVRFWFQNRRQKARAAELREERLAKKPKLYQPTEYRADPFSRVPTHFYSATAPTTATIHSPSRPSAFYMPNPFTGEYQPMILGTPPIQPHPMPSSPRHSVRKDVGRRKNTRSINVELAQLSEVSLGPQGHTCCQCVSSVHKHCRSLARLVPCMGDEDSPEAILRGTISYIRNLQSFVNTGALSSLPLESESVVSLSPAHSMLQSEDSMHSRDGGDGARMMEPEEYTTLLSADSPSRPSEEEQLQY